MKCLLIATALVAVTASTANAQFVRQPFPQVPQAGGYPIIVSPQGQFLGNTNPNTFDPNSVNNPMTYGNPFQANGVNNQFSPNYLGGRRF